MTDLTQRQRILRVLDALGEAYGLDIVRGSAGKVSRLGLYVHLTELESEGLVFGRYCEPYRSDGIPRRKAYKLTGLGEREARSIHLPLSDVFAHVSRVVAGALADHLPRDGVSWILVERRCALQVVLRHRRHMYARGLAAGIPIGLGPALPNWIALTARAAHLPLWVHAMWHRLLGRRVRRG